MDRYAKPVSDYMEAEGLTQKQMAERVGIAQSTLSSIIHGVSVPSEQTIKSFEGLGIVFDDWEEPLETIPVEKAAYILNMSVECLKQCLRQGIFDFGVAPEGFSRYIIWKDKFQRFIER